MAAAAAAGRGVRALAGALRGRGGGVGRAGYQTVRSGAAASGSEAAPPGARVERLNHVAVVVPDLERASARYREALGARVSAPEDLPEHGVRVVFVELENSKIELLHPLDASSPVQKFLEKNPAGGIHHVCLEVGDIHTALAGLEGHSRVLNPEPKIGAHGNPVVFLHPKDNDGVLLELEQAT